MRPFPQVTIWELPISNVPLISLIVRFKISYRVFVFLGPQSSAPYIRSRPSGGRGGGALGPSPPPPPPQKKWPLQFQRVGWYNRDEIKITHKNVVIFKNITCIEKNKHPNKLNSLFTDVNLHKLKFS